MPKRTSTMLGAMFGATLSLYIALVIFTVTLATWQTDLASAVGNTEASIASLESRYYASISAITSEDPAALGLVDPAHTAYARSATAPVLTRAGF